MNISMRGISKTYPGGVTALQHLDLEIGSGMFGLLGPNGAGKSTLMKILATLEKPSSGKILFNNEDINENRACVRASLGYLPQFFGVYPQLTGNEFLTYIAQLNGIPGRDLKKRVLQTLERVGLAADRDRKAKTYSGGMLRRLGIAQAVVADPRLLIVDEPTTGLDPEERIRFRNLLTDISREKIIILSTHIVGDISSTCENLAVLAQGNIVYTGRPDALIERAAGKVWQVKIRDDQFSTIADTMQVISTIPMGEQLLLRVVGDPVPGFEMERMQANLEDAYIHFMEAVVGQRLDDKEDIEAAA